MNRYRILLVLIILLSIATQIIWVKIDRRPPAYDEAAYLERSLELSETIRIGPVEFIKSVLGLGRYQSTYHPHRALLPLTTLLFYFLFGKSPDVGVMSNLVYIIVLLTSIYGIGKILFSKRAGVLSAFLFSTFPLFCFITRVFMPVLSATALATLSVYLLIRSDYFKQRGPSLSFGITFGLGLVTEEFYLVAILGPLAYVVWKSNPFKKRATLVNFGGSILLGLLIASFWYLPNYQYIINNLLCVAYSQNVGELYGVPTRVGFPLFSFYIVAISYGISLFYSVVLCVILFPFWKSKGQKWLFILWLIIPYIILTSARGSKSSIYILLVLPAVAIIIAKGILMGIHSRKIKRVVLSIIISVGLLQLFAYSFDLGLLSRIVKWRAVENKSVSQAFPKFPDETFPLKGDWKTDEIIKFIDEDREVVFPHKKECIIKVVPDCPYISWIVFAYSIKLKELPFEVKRGDPQHMRPINYDQVLNGCDYVVIKTGEQGEGDWDRAFMMEYAQKILAQLRTSPFFEELDARFLLPDGSLVYIYRTTYQRAGYRN